MSLGSYEIDTEKKMRAFLCSTHSTEASLLLDKNENYCMPKRFVFSSAAFVAASLAVSFNMNLSIAIVSMVCRNTSAGQIAANDTLSKCSEGWSLDWTADEQSIALGAVYVGQLISFIPGGRMAELYGGKKMLILCILLAAVSTALSPAAVYIGVYAFVAARFVVGLGTGPVIPIIFFMLSRWIPSSERSFHASFIISGYGIGSFLAVIVSGALCSSTVLGGWPSVYYVGGVSGGLWCLMAYFAMYELPEDHPGISHEEILLIHNGTDANSTDQITKIPWKQMMISVPLWALAFGFFGQFWLLGFFSTVHAIYMGTVLELPIAENGELSSLPHLLRAIATCAASYPVDLMLQKKMVSIGFVRKGATVINTVVSCAAFLGITLVGHNTVATTLLFVAGGIFGEFVTFGVCMACIDIAPNLAGTVSGIINIVGVFPFFMVPSLVGWLTDYERSVEKWKSVFYVTIAITAITTLIFVVFGDLRPQPWGTRPPKTNEQPQTKKQPKAKSRQEMIRSYNGTANAAALPATSRSLIASFSGRMQRTW